MRGWGGRPSSGPLESPPPSKRPRVILKGKPPRGEEGGKTVVGTASLQEARDVGISVRDNGAPASPRTVTRAAPVREGAPRSGVARNGLAPRSTSLREAPARDGAPREGAGREAPAYDGGPREGGGRDPIVREGAGRHGAVRKGAPRDSSAENVGLALAVREGGAPRNALGRDDAREAAPRNALGRDDAREAAPVRGRAAAQDPEGGARSGSTRDGAARDGAARKSVRDGAVRRAPREPANDSDLAALEAAAAREVPAREGGTREGASRKAVARNGVGRDGAREHATRDDADPEAGAREGAMARHAAAHDGAARNSLAPTPAPGLAESPPPQRPQRPQQRPQQRPVGEAGEVVRRATRSVFRSHVRTGPPRVRAAAPAAQAPPPLEPAGARTVVQEVVTFDVGGQEFKVAAKLVRTKPDALLARLLQESGDSVAKPIFVDGCPGRFPYILDWYRYQEIHVPDSVPLASVLRDAKYFGLPDEVVVNGTLRSTKGHDAALKVGRELIDEIVRRWAGFSHFLEGLQRRISAHYSGVGAASAQQRAAGAGEGQENEEEEAWDFPPYVLPLYTEKGWEEPQHICSTARARAVALKLEERGYHCAFTPAELVVSLPLWLRSERSGLGGGEEPEEGGAAEGGGGAAEGGGGA